VVDRAGRPLAQVERHALLEAFRDLTRLHAAEHPISVAATLPSRDPIRLEEIEARWKQFFGAPLDAPDLAPYVNAAPAWHTRAHARLCMELGHVEQTCRRAAELFEKFEHPMPGDVTAPGTLVPDVRHTLVVLRELADRMARLHGDKLDEAKRLLSPAWWIEQRDQAALALYDWCRPRVETEFGLRPLIVEGLWSYRWDVDPDSKRDLAAISKALQRRRRARR
jgi:hypothetical protein